MSDSAYLSGLADWMLDSAVAPSASAASFRHMTADASRASRFLTNPAMAAKHWHSSACSN
jgi:hypothetical protein